jgi:hypothetical protein
MKVYQSPETLALYSQQARKSVEKFLDVKRLTDEYENVFRQIINSK